MGFGRADRNRYGWPNKVIPYTIHDAAFPPGSTAQKLIEDTGGAIDHWHNNTSIRLVKRQQEADYVVFTPDATACHGPVGRHAGEQQISCALAGDPVAPPGAGVALAKQTDTVLTAVVVDDLGGLSVAWVNDTDGWDGPVHLDGNFRPGAPVGLAKQTEDVLTALAVDEEGVLNAAWVVGTGQWTGPVKFGPANFKPGATPVALAKQTDDILTAVAVDKFGFLNVAWVEGAGKPWNGPVPFGTPEFPTDPDLPVGVALAKQTEDVLTALAVDNNGRLSVASLAGTGQQWQGPAPFGEPRFFKGAPVAMAKQTDDILTAAAVDKDGNLNVAWVVGTGQWEGPIRIGGEFPPDKRKTRKAGKLPSDQHTHVALAKQTDDILTALAIDRTGALNAAWVDGTGEWSSVAWGPANLPPGAPVAMAKQTDDILTAVTVFSNGALGIAWVVGTVEWNGPAPFRSGKFGRGNLIHEIGHAVGLFHEHQRPDRGSFVTVNEGNILGSKDDFEIVNGELPLGMYDCGSIMHYGQFAFSRTAGGKPLPTIDPKPGGCAPTRPIGRRLTPIGQRKGLSASDIASVASLYP